MGQAFNEAVAYRVAHYRENDRDIGCSLLHDEGRLSAPGDDDVHISLNQIASEFVETVGPAVRPAVFDYDPFRRPAEFTKPLFERRDTVCSNGCRGRNEEADSRLSVVSISA